MAFPSTAGTPAQASFNAATTGAIDATGYSAGDALLCVVSQDGTATWDIDVPNSSSGWVKLDQWTNSGATVTAAAFYKKNAAGAGSDTLTLDATGAERGTYILQPITGQDTTTDAYIVVGGASGAAGVNVTDPPNLAPGVGSMDFLFVAIGGLASFVVMSAAPANYTGLVNQSTQTSSCSTHLAFRQLTAASDDPGTFTHNSSAWLANTVAIPPAGAPSVPPILAQARSPW